MSTRSPWEYAAIFAVYATVMLTASESDNFGDVASTLAWLVFVGAVVKWFRPLNDHISKLTGKQLA